MRISITLLAGVLLASLFFLTPSAEAQFDLGKVFRGEARQAIQGIERQIRNEIRNGGGFVQPLPRPNPPRHDNFPMPYPPVYSLQPVPQPQPCPQPPVVILPQPPIVSPGPGFPGDASLPPVAETPGSVITTRKPAQSEPQPETEAEPLPQVELGSVISIDGQGFGDQPGAVLIKIDQLVLRAELVEWTDERVEAQMPDMPMANPVGASIFVIAATDEIAERVDVALLPASDDAEEGTAESDSVDISTLPQVSAGQEVTLEGDLGEGQGRVELVIGSVRLATTIKQWSNSAATIQLPSVDSQEPVAAELIIYNADGQVVEQLQVGFSG